LKLHIVELKWMNYCEFWSFWPYHQGPCVR